MKNKKNIIFFIAGLITAALLWQFYLKPKYEIKSGDKETLEILLNADKAALQEATDKIGGEVIFNSSQVQEEQGADGALAPVGEEVDKTSPNSIIDTKGDKDFVFASRANKPKSVYEQMAEGDKRGKTHIVLEKKDIVVKMPKVKEEDAAPFSSEEDDGTLQGSRITLISAPAKFHVIKSEAQYKKFKEGKKGTLPKVNFAKDMIVFVESDTNMSNGFFEIAEVLPNKKEVLVNYRVNIIGSSEKNNDMPYKVFKRTDKPVNFKQIK